MMIRLAELAAAIRSSNAGATWLTFDIMFDRVERFSLVRDSKTITAGSMGALFGVAADQVRIFVYEPALTIKITIPRSVLAGNPADRDIDGKQQHAPLLDIEIPDRSAA